MSEAPHAVSGHKTLTQAVKIILAVLMLFIYLFPLELDLRFSKELAVAEKRVFQIKPKVA